MLSLGFLLVDLAAGLSLAGLAGRAGLGGRSGSHRLAVVTAGSGSHRWLGWLCWLSWLCKAVVTAWR